MSHTSTGDTIDVVRHPNEGQHGIPPDKPKRLHLFARWHPGAHVLGEAAQLVAGLLQSGVDPAWSGVDLGDGRAPSEAPTGCTTSPSQSALHQTGRCASEHRPWILDGWQVSPRRQQRPCLRPRRTHRRMLCGAPSPPRPSRQPCRPHGARERTGRVPCAGSLAVGGRRHPGRAPQQRGLRSEELRGSGAPSLERRRTPRSAPPHSEVVRPGSRRPARIRSRSSSAICLYTGRSLVGSTPRATRPPTLV